MAEGKVVTAVDLQPRFHINTTTIVGVVISHFIDISLRVLYDVCKLFGNFPLFPDI